MFFMDPGIIAEQHVWLILIYSQDCSNQNWVLSHKIDLSSLKVQLLDIWRLIYPPLTCVVSYFKLYMKFFLLYLFINSSLQRV